MKKLTIFLLVMLLLPGCGSKKVEERSPALTPKPAVPVESTPAVTQTAETTATGQSTQPAMPTQPATKPASTPQPVKTEAQPAQLPKLWDFFAVWCPPCKQQAPIIEELAEEYKGKIEILSIDTDKNTELARKFQIQAIPTLVFLDAEGRELSRRVGFFPKDSIVARFKTHGFIK